MSKKDQFIEWLREKILQNPAEPAANTWEQISESLDIEDSWEQVGEELDIDGVWDKVGARLEQYEKLVWFEKAGQRLSLAAAIILLFGHFLFQPIIQPAIPSLSQQEDRAELDISGQRQAENPSVDTPESSETGLQTSGSGSDVVNSNNTTLAQSKTPDLEISSSDHKADPQEAMATVGIQEAVAQVEVGSGIHSLKTQGDELANIPAITLPAAPERLAATFINPKAKLPAILESARPEVADIKAPEDEYMASYVGLGGALKLSGLLNDKTIYALERNSLTSSSPDWQQDVFILYGTRIADKWLLQADFYLLDKAGQQYNEYREGTYANFKHELTYQSLGLNVSKIKRQLSYGSMPLYARWVGGLFVGRLQAARERSVFGEQDRSAEYRQFKAGLLAGYEHDLFLHRQFVLTYGVRGRMDLLNVYSGTENIPSSFRSTRPFSLDFSVSFKYVLNK